MPIERDCDKIVHWSGVFVFCMFVFVFWMFVFLYFCILYFETMISVIANRKSLGQGGALEWCHQGASFSNQFTLFHFVIFFSFLYIFPFFCTFCYIFQFEFILDHAWLFIVPPPSPHHYTLLFFHLLLFSPPFSPLSSMSSF